MYIAPFILVYLTSIVSGLLTAVYHLRSSTVDVGYELRVVFSTWILSAFILDLSMTSTSEFLPNNEPEFTIEWICLAVVYLYRSRTGLGEHDSAFSAIWQITWASAAPPLILMIAVIIEARGVKGLSHTEVIFVADMTGKFFVLSLMISLVGRGYIRQKLDGLSKHMDPLDISISNPVETNLPVFVSGVSIRIETTKAFTDSQIATMPHRISLAHPMQTEGGGFGLPGSEFDSNIDLSTHHSNEKKSG
ncbi:hypothetical protein RhiJN_19724 [Ceratobasidium sp. AG-Ba]|nr:hypothetical protein RhiJN_04894 [Ceratobasidium sp. AG-Ba]QRV91706.1 hypothetical protein RhiJN_19724 [Ceratobasidium sp. AG-Ba]